MKIQHRSSSCKIKNIGKTSAKISGRGGLHLYLRYLESTNLFPLLETTFQRLRKSRKSKAVSNLFRQLISFMMDGTSSSVNYFDILQNDPGYAGVLEVEPKDLASSHAIKRFLRKFISLSQAKLFRSVLNSLFIWRLKIEKPKQIILDIDTMVLDNSCSKKRNGVKATYKKGVKGFQNLQITWNGRLVDAIFRNGSAHSNHGNDVKNSLKRVIKLIRNHYNNDVKIIITMDSGFFSEDTYHFLDKTMRVYFVGVGKMYNDLKAYISEIPENNYSIFSNKQNLWHYIEFRDKRRCWKKCGYLRAIYTRFMTDDNGQVLMEFSRPDTILYTNMGCCSFSKQKNFKPEEIILLAHGRGRSELVNRSFKEFMGTENLPFKLFGMNAAWYYLQAISHFCFESFKIDNMDMVEGIGVEVMPNTFRRKIIDFAVKIVKKSNSIILKVSEAVWDGINLEALWKAVNKVPPIIVPERCY